MISYAILMICFEIYLQCYEIWLLQCKLWNIQINGWIILYAIEQCYEIRTKAPPYTSDMQCIAKHMI